MTVLAYPCACACQCEADVSHHRATCFWCKAGVCYNPESNTVTLLPMPVGMIDELLFGEDDPEP